MSLLSVPLNVHVLTALEDEPRPLPELRRAAGSPPATTMRGHLRTLTGLRVVECVRRNQFPGNADLTLGRAGHGLLSVARAVEDWLANSEEGPIELGTMAAKSSIKALVEAWSNNIVRAFAARPLSLTELDRLITSLNYPSLERRLAALRDVGLVAPCEGHGRGTPYAVTNWLRGAIAPLVAAARWERRYAPDTSRPIGRLDIEAAFLLAVPMITFTSGSTATCRLAVEIRQNGEDGLAGVLAEVEGGQVRSCSSCLSGRVDASVTGSSRAWLRAVADQDTRHLNCSGDHGIAVEVVDGLHRALMRAPQLS